jgi:hypothetical protein
MRSPTQTGLELPASKRSPRAQEHFREALRLDPDLEYAREGMLEALKARNPVYRAMLAYFLWLGRQSARFQWAFIIGIFVGSRIARSLSASQPDLKWLWVPVLVLFYAFVYLSWTAQPMFNLMLRFNRFGRHVLSADQRTGANWFGVTFGLALAAIVWWLATGHEIGMFSAVALAVLSICVAATFNRAGRDRTILGTCTHGTRRTRGRRDVVHGRGLCRRGDLHECVCDRLHRVSAPRQRTRDPLALSGQSLPHIRVYSRDSRESSHRLFRGFLFRGHSS